MFENVLKSILLLNVLTKFCVVPRHHQSTHRGLVVFRRCMAEVMMSGEILGMREVNFP